MKIVVTGAASFVGKELISQCKTKNIEVIGIDAIDLHDIDYEFHKCDIKSSKINDIIPENVDAIIHLAALSRDQDCREKGYECFDTNVMGTLNLIKVCLEKNVKQFIFASSEWVYDKFEGDKEKDENAYIDISNHTSEYALSKLVSESNLRQQFNHKLCSTTILRFGIIYGPRKSNWSAVETIASAVKNQDEVSIGSLKTGRRFIHVSDIANGIIQSLNLKGFNIINLTSDRIITLDDIINTSQKMFKKSIKINETNPTNVNIRNPSNQKAKKILNWEPKISLVEGLNSINDFI
jgi:UDP-glucose 4-epimerase